VERGGGFRIFIFYFPRRRSGKEKLGYREREKWRAFGYGISREIVTMGRVFSGWQENRRGNEEIGGKLGEQGESGEWDAMGIFERLCKTEGRDRGGCEPDFGHGDRKE